jgi:hypothetical protein
MKCSKFWHASIIPTTRCEFNNGSHAELFFFHILGRSEFIALLRCGSCNTMRSPTLCLYILGPKDIREKFSSTELDRMTACCVICMPQFDG